MAGGGRRGAIRDRSVEGRARIQIDAGLGGFESWSIISLQATDLRRGGKEVDHKIGHFLRSLPNRPMAEAGKALQAGMRNRAKEIEISPGGSAQVSLTMSGGEQ